MTMKQYIEKCLSGESLTADEAAGALELIMTDQASESQIAGLLVALRAKGETVDEIVGFARTMREKSVKVKAEDPHAIDMCGTGGDGLGTFNISTLASLVAGGAGVTVAKHGNRSVSSRSGSADLLKALGVNITLTPERAADCLNSVGVSFLFAPLFHPAMKFAAKTRTDLGVRTIFNLLGPITNPAGVRKQLIGTFREDVANRLADAIGRLSTERACVVHSNDGMDEVGVAGATSVFEVGAQGAVKKYTVTARTFGLPERPGSSVVGGTPEENAGIALRVLERAPGPHRDVVVANAAFGIYVSGKADDLAEASAMAAESIDSGRAMSTLRRLVEYTNRP
ncbi:MAG TPA: anthranilate phosphoribosyltransferase [Bacteroidota bacterium]|nr:anthranilate phosphoribosyltransferase [Bacteroidota bacterium]